MHNSDYAFAVAKIRHAEADLLTQGQLDSAIDSADISRTAYELQKCGIKVYSSPPLASEIFESEGELLAGLWDFAGELLPKDQLMPFMVLGDYHNLKAALRLKICGQNRDDLFKSCWVSVSPDIIKDAVLSGDYSEISEFEPVLTELAGTGDIRAMEAAVDKAALTALYDTAQKSESDVYKLYADTVLNYADVNIAFRMCGLGFGFEMINKALISTDKLEGAALAKSAAGGNNQLLEYLQSTELFDVVPVLEQGGAGLYKWFYDRLIEKIMPQRFNPFTAQPIAAYIIARLSEIKNAKTILLLKNAGFDSESIRKRCVISYVSV